MREASWTDSTGSRTAIIVPEGGRIITSFDRCYSAKFKDAKGKWVRKSTGTSDREAAKSIASKWEADAKQRQTGAIDGVAETLAKHGNRPIEEHLNAFRATKDGTESHRHQTPSHIEEFAAAGGWECIADIDANDVTAHVEMMRAAKSAARTIQARLRSIKSFRSGSPLTTSYALNRFRWFPSQILTATAFTNGGCYCRTNGCGWNWR